MDLTITSATPGFYTRTVNFLLLDSMISCKEDFAIHRQNEIAVTLYNVTKCPPAACPNQNSNQTLVYVVLRLYGGQYKPPCDAYTE